MTPRTGYNLVSIITYLHRRTFKCMDLHVTMVRVLPVQSAIVRTFSIQSEKSFVLLQFLSGRTCHETASTSFARNYVWTSLVVSGILHLLRCAELHKLYRMFLERIDETLQLSLFGRRDSAAAISAVRAVVRGDRKSVV